MYLNNTLEARDQHNFFIITFLLGYAKSINISRFLLVKYEFIAFSNDINN